MLEGWTDFFVATAGAGSALAGLIIVAMSVNIQRISEAPSLSSRASATVGSLVLVVVAMIAGLVPEQPLPMLGAEILIFGIGASVLTVHTARAMQSDPQRHGRTWPKIVMLVVQIVPFLIAGGLLITGTEAGLYWLAGGVVLVFIGATLNAWVLLVEILR
jgi:hypothetical protein